VGVVDALNHPWAYEYNALGSLAKVTAPDGKVRQFAYDSSNQLVAESHPESGTTLYSWVWGRMTSKRDANNSLISYDYDFNDRLTQIYTSTKSTIISYETASDKRQSTTVLGSGETVFVYDTAGRVAERKEIIGPYVFFSRYEYDTNDNVIAITYPSQRRVEYTYNAENQITKVSEPAAGRDYARMMTYHPSGGLTAYTLGNQIQGVARVRRGALLAVARGIGAVAIVVSELRRRGECAIDHRRAKRSRSALHL
jgi:YD repeat-containing protein